MFILNKDFEKVLDNIGMIIFSFEIEAFKLSLSL